MENSEKEEQDSQQEDQEKSQEEESQEKAGAESREEAAETESQEVEEQTESQEVEEESEVESQEEAAPEQDSLSGEHSLQEESITSVDEDDTLPKENDEPNPKEFIIKTGIILGIINIILTLVFYIVDQNMLVGFTFIGIGIVINLGYLTYSGISFRRDIGGYIKFGSAYKNAFLSWAVAGIIGTIFAILLHHVIDPDLQNALKEAQVENAIALTERFGGDDEAIEKAEAETLKRTEGQFDIPKLLLGYVYALIFYAIFSLIVGAIVKRNEPEERF